MQPSCSYTLPGTDLHVHLSTRHARESIGAVVANYGLVTPRHPVEKSARASIVITTRCGAPSLPEELELLSPLEAILCKQHIYVNDSRLSLGPPIRVESKSASSIPRTGLDVALTLCFAQQGAITLHACGFRYRGTDFLAFGPSKMGKSTLAAAILTSGGQILTDDQLLCHMDNGALHARWLRRDMLLREGGMQVLTETIRQQTTPLQINGETRWKLNRRLHAAGFADSLKPSILLFLQPPELDRTTPTVLPINHGMAYSELIRASSPALFGQSAVAIPALSRTCRSLLAATTAFQLAASPNLISHPQNELLHLMDAIGLKGP